VGAAIGRRDARRHLVGKADTLSRDAPGSAAA
jgi:hypothetical protein